MKSTGRYTLTFICTSYFIIVF